MSDRKFRVGIIGADTQASWADAAYIPALQAQPSLVLAAVATRWEESVQADATAFGASRGFAAPMQSSVIRGHFLSNSMARQRRRHQKSKSEIMKGE